MAFSPLPKNYDEAIKEINVWRAKYTREARDEIEAQRRQVAEAKSIALDAESEARIATERADKERDRSDEAMAENAALLKLLGSCSEAMQHNHMKYQVTDWTHMIAAIDAARKA